MSEQDERPVPDARPGDPDLTHRRVLPADETDLTHRRALPAEPQAPEVPAGVPRFDAPAEPGPVAPAPTDPAPTEPAGGPAEQDAGTAPSSSASPAPSGPEPTPAPVQRLMPPTQAIQRSRVAEEFVTHTPGQRNEAQVVDDGRWLAPGDQRRREAADLSAAASNPVEATLAEAAAAQHETTAPQQQPAPQPAPPGRVPTSPQGETQLASPPTQPSQAGPGDAVVPTGAPALPPDAYSPQSTGGLGDLPDQPIVTLPPLAEAIAGYPISERTGEPVRNPVILASMLSFGASALAATAAYWWYWWVAINITNFHDSSALIRWLEPRPGSGSSVVLVCVMAIIGAIMTAGPGVAGYNVWHGASFSRIAGLVACGTSLLAVFVSPWAWIALAFAAIGTGLLWLPQSKAFLQAWDAYANPPRPEIKPYENVAYGPAPRYR